ncbi:MAG TPA: sulfite exporter TauE/SafE family protein [Puia sp.]|nr:sulfite exporter TauE/SafE family protein [Puia sp.]
MTAAFSAAFVLGLIGSLHCIGMCGPLALALPFKGGRAARFSLSLRYHAGRICTYALGGVLFGWFGRGIRIAGWQQGFSIALGVMIVVLTLGDRWLEGVGRLYAPVRQAILRILYSASGKGSFLLGMANGLLPCGMVYLAIAGALTRPTVAGSMGFMAFFGAGTLPLLLGLQWTGRLFPVSWRHRLRGALPLVTVVVGLLLILRGLDLGIPFVSPALPPAPGQAVSCH